MVHIALAHSPYIYLHKIISKYAVAGSSYLLLDLMQFGDGHVIFSLNAEKRLTLQVSAPQNDQTHSKQFAGNRLKG